MGFQNIIKVLKSGEQNLSCRCLKLKPLRYSTNHISDGFVVYRCHNMGISKI